MAKTKEEINDEVFGIAQNVLNLLVHIAKRSELPEFFGLIVQDALLRNFPDYPRKDSADNKLVRKCADSIRDKLFVKA